MATTRAATVLVQENCRDAEHSNIQEQIVESGSAQVPVPGGGMVLGAHLLGKLHGLNQMELKR